MFTEPENNTYFIPIYDSQKNENIIPIITFVSKRIAALKKSFSTSTDSDEKNEIIAAILFHQSTLLILCIPFFTESPELNEIAKDIFRYDDKRL